MANTKNAKETTKKKTTTTKKKNTTKKTTSSKTTKPVEKKTKKEVIAEEMVNDNVVEVSEEPKKKNSKKKVEKQEVVKNTDSKKEDKSSSKFSVPTGDGEKHLRNLIIIIVVTLLFLAIGYVLTVFLIDNRNMTDDSSEEAIIQYDYIMIGSMLNQPDKDYYVLISAEDDAMAGTYSDYAYAYSQKEKALKVYTADYTEGFNSQYVAETSNLKVSNISEFKVKGSTLVKVSNKKVVEAYEGKEAILNKLLGLIK